MATDVPTSDPISGRPSTKLEASPSTTTTNSCKVVLAQAIAKPLLEEIKQGLTKVSRQPHLVGILANVDPAAQLYADWTRKTCEENGFLYTLITVPLPANVEDAILTANTSPTTDGIIVYYPIFSSRQDQYLQQLVSLPKDVEGLSHQYIFNMYQNIRFLDPPPSSSTSTTPPPLLKSILPCTPLAVIKTLEHLHIYNPILPYGNRLFGHNILVVNRSEVVGRPLAALLANDGACVYSVDITGVQQFTRGAGLRNRKHDVVDLPKHTLESCVPLCDVVISGVPGEKFKFPCQLLRDGAVCVNFSSERNFGPEVKERAGLYVPAIGKVTIAILLRNLLRLVQNREVQERNDVVNGASS